MGITENKKIKSQMAYIFRRIKDMSVCKVIDRYTEEMDRVSVPLVKEILQNRYTNGPDMNALLCLFDTMVLSTQIKKDSGLYQLSTTIKEWANQLSQIDVKSSESKVYMSDILSGIPVIIKSPKNKDNYNNLIREYYIGISEINKLRYYVPNFMYTLGAFLYPDKRKKSAFVIYEKIPGENLEKLLKEDRINFGQFLGIFIQILMALELAQRQIRFCHFDLHAANIILRPLESPFSYTVVLDNKRYNVVARDYLPVMIDFGMSTVVSGDRTIGSFCFEKYGMMPYLIQGADMYKLLYYCALHTRNGSPDLHRGIMELFSFYGTDDPYKILISKPDYLKKISYEYAKNVSFTKAATYTPLDFITWLYTRPEYSLIITSYINKYERDIYFPLNYSSTIQQYSDIFEHSEEARRKAIDMAQQCTSAINPSYVLLDYTRGLLEMYDHNLQSEELKSRLGDINMLMKKQRRNLLHDDKKMLMTYSGIKIPDKIKLQDCISQILNTHIRSTKNMNGLITNFLHYSKILSNILPYLQLLYTIRELHLNERYKTYRNYVLRFTESDQYHFYIELNRQIERTKRWSITLLESTDA